MVSDSRGHTETEQTEVVFLAPLTKGLKARADERRGVGGGFLRRHNDNDDDTKFCFFLGGGLNMKRTCEQHQRKKSLVPGVEKANEADGKHSIAN